MRTRPVVITDAERSQGDQLRSRQIRYASMMGLRIVCLVGLVVLVSAKVPLLWLWAPLCALGMIILPWAAVLVANDRLPKEEHTLRGKIARRRAAVATRNDTSGITSTPHDSRII